MTYFSYFQSDRSSYFSRLFSMHTHMHAHIHAQRMEVLYTVLTLLGHANIEAFLQPTGLTPVPCDLVNDTDFVSVACVYHVLLDAPPKEALTQRNAGD